MPITTQLRYNGSNKKVRAAVAEANRILSNNEFYNKIEAINKFDFTKYTGLDVSNEIKQLNKVIEVNGYWNPFTVTNAKTQTEININTAKLNRPNSSIVNTLIHETVHAVDWLTNANWDYTHNGQSPTDQGNTAPWVIGDIAESMSN